jgi:hypothetical protein
MATPFPPSLTAGNPTLLAPGESGYLLPGDHSFQNILGKFVYTVIVLGDNPLRLTTVIEYEDGHTETIGSGVDHQSEYSRTVDGSICHVAHYDWPDGTHEELLRLNFHEKIKHVALVLRTPSDLSPLGPRSFATHILSGEHMAIPDQTRLHYQINTVEAADDPVDNRHVVALIHFDGALRLEALDLRCADPAQRSYLRHGTVSFGQAMGDPDSDEDPAS